MATLDWHVTADNGVALVTVLVESETTERIRVTNRLDGPVWPPRRQGVPAAGWDEDGYEGVIERDERLVLGYACPAKLSEPPATLTTLGSGDVETTVSAREVIQSLGDPRPPRDAIGGTERSLTVDRTPDSTESAGTNTDEHETARVDGCPEDPSCGWVWGKTNGQESGRTDGNGNGLPTRDGTTGEQSGDGSATSEWLADIDEIEGKSADADEIEEWLVAVTRRVSAAEQLAEVTSVAEASEAVASVGGPENVARLQTQLEADRERLDRLATECADLASRVVDVEVPVETLERLA